MSIATDEATEYARHRYFGRVHIERRDGNAEIMPNDPRQINFRREGYIAGRTADVTDAEVEAVAKALYMAKAWNRLDEVTPRWDDQSPEVRGNYMMNAESLLKVARQAVTE